MKYLILLLLPFSVSAQQSPKVDLGKGPEWETRPEIVAVKETLQLHLHGGWDRNIVFYIDGKLYDPCAAEEPVASGKRCKGRNRKEQQQVYYKGGAVNIGQTITGTFYVVDGKICKSETAADSFAPHPPPVKYDHPHLSGSYSGKDFKHIPLLFFLAQLPELRPQ